MFVISRGASEIDCMDVEPSAYSGKVNNLIHIIIRSKFVKDLSMSIDDILPILFISVYPAHFI
jgi:hypothetical protein